MKGVKLNKGEKRMLKFSQAQGEDLSEVGDLKSHLNNKMEKEKYDKGTKMKAGVKVEKKYNSRQVAKKGNDYRQLEEFKDEFKDD